MAINTFALLKSAVGDWLARDDLTSYLDDFVTLAEDYLNRQVMHREMVVTTDLTPTSYVCTLPNDYLHYIRVVEKASIRRELTHIPMTAADELYPAQDAGLSWHFTIVGNSLTAWPRSTNAIELTYRQKIPALSDSNATNWLLTASPNVYLRATQMMALDFINETNTPRYQNVARLTEMAINNLNDESKLGEFYRTNLVIQGCTP